MSDFRRDSRGGGRSYGGGRTFGGDRGGNRSGPREMFKTTCSNCGKECEVPFRPTSGKPVFCNDCFREQNGGEARRPERRDMRSNDRPRERSDFGGGRPEGPNYQEQFDALNNKLDRIIEMINPDAFGKRKVKEEKAIPAEEVQMTEEAAPIKKKRLVKAIAEEAPAVAEAEVGTENSMEMPGKSAEITDPEVITTEE